jgi:alkylhydroperoxidase family enzyme
MPRIQPADLAQMPNFASNGSSTMTQLFKTMGHRPELMRDAMQLVETAMRTGTVETQLKELIAIRVSQVNNCFY